MTVKAMRAGAVDFLTKPVRDQELIDAVHAALNRDREMRKSAAVLADLRGRFATLTERERDVVALLTVGKRNKQIAAELGVTEGTIKVHRSVVMKKLDARSLADLVRIVDICLPNAHKA